jgi:hypothetical protein
MEYAYGKGWCAAVLLIAGAALTTTAAADKPSWAGDKGEHGAKQEQREDHGRDERRDERRDAHRDEHGDVRVNSYFGDRHRVAVRDYYAGEFHAGRCPPGLAKKGNGCMPPGQAKKAWVMGRPLPHDVVYYQVPHDLEVRIGLPPSGYQYVRVASDILMIAAGTGMVVDAIQDLGGR